MTRLRAVIADDERLARQKIRRLAAAHDGLEIVAEAASGLDTLAAVHRHRPGLLFLDVRMPGMDGFEVLRQLAGSRPPRVVFTTAHDEFAVAAFDAEALDYLLKPFDRRRFDRAVRRALDSEQLASSDCGTREALERLATLVERAAPAPERVTRFLVDDRGRMRFVPADDVKWIAAEGKYVRLHVAGNSYLLRHGLNSLAERLDPRRFLRVHRSLIVNVCDVQEIHRGAGDGSVVRLRDGSRLPLSRRYRSRLQTLL